MRQGNNNQRRGRGRGNKRPSGNSRNQSFDSHGPNVRVRGTAPQLVEKYLAMARDASGAGDRVMAENYFQHADHYNRIYLASQPPQDESRSEQPATGDGEDAAPADAAAANRRGRRPSDRRQRANGQSQDPGRETQPDSPADAEGGAAATNNANGHANGRDSDVNASDDAADAPAPKPRRRRAAAKPADEPAPEAAPEATS